MIFDKANNDYQKQVNEEAIKKLALMMTEILCNDPEKDNKYINFLSKHKLPNSGPTPELLSSLSKEQRAELVNIIKP